MADSARNATDEEGVLEANRAFYRIFAAGDLEAMRRMWSTTEPVQCTHPGMAPLHGRDAILESWSEIFEGGPPAITPSQARVSIVRGVGFVACLEALATGVLAATNVFVWESRSWKLVHHQAGPVSATRLPTAPPNGRVH